VDAGTDWGRIVVLGPGGDEVVSWILAGAGRPDLDVVANLVRLQLMARRVGCSIRLRDASPDLADLLQLVGLADVVPPPDGLGQVRRQPEDGEQLGIQEAVDPGDAVA
jgi:hypothetical protein